MACCQLPESLACCQLLNFRELGLLPAFRPQVHPQISKPSFLATGSESAFPRLNTCHLHWARFTLTFTGVEPERLSGIIYILRG